MSRHYFGLNRATVNFEQGSAKSELHQGQKKKKKKKYIIASTLTQGLNSTKLQK